MTTKVDTLSNLMNLAGTPDGRRYFIENAFSVINREGQKVPLKFLPLQEVYWNNRTLRDRYLKFRQGGISTIVHADVISEAMLRPGMAARIYVQSPEDKTLPVHRDRAQMFIDSAVANGFQTWREQTAKSDHHIQFNFEGGVTSSIYFTASGSESVGRGETLSRIIREELGEWDEASIRTTQQVMRGLPIDSRVIDIGTPNGLGTPFHGLWDKAKDGRENFASHFYPWFMGKDEYFLPEGHPVIQDKVDYKYDFEPTDEEQALMEAHDLSIDNIRWRRYQIDDAGSKEDFWQEYAEDEFTCWLLGGQPVMPSQVLTSWANTARQPIKKDLWPTQLQNQNKWFDILRLWAAPQSGEQYVIMGDPAGGVGGHKSAAVIRRIRGWEHVASLRGQIPPGEFGGMLMELGHLYNNAMIGWESNNHGHGVHERVVSHRYPYIYKYKGKLREEDNKPKYGFPTSRWTKPGLVTNMVEFMQAGYWSSPDMELISEYRILQLKKTALGNDEYDTDVLDLAMADLMCLEASDQAERRFKPRPKAQDQLPKWLQR